MTKEELTREKKKLVKLLAAFAIATKHHLRAEAGIRHADLEGERSCSVEADDRSVAASLDALRPAWIPRWSSSACVSP